MGMSSPSIAGQYPGLSAAEWQRRSSNVHNTRLSRDPSNASSVARGEDSGLNQRVLTTHVGREPTRIARKKLPWLDGGQQSKPGDVHVPGSFEPAEKSLEDATSSFGEPVATVPNSDAPTGSPPDAQARSQSASMRALGDDPTLRAVGSTPSLQARKRSVQRSRTLSLTSDPRPGIKPTPTKQHAKRALGIVSEKSVKAEDYTPSEYSATMSSDTEPGSCTSCDSQPPKPAETPAIPPPTIVKRPLVVPKAPPPHSASRERGLLLPDTIVKRRTTMPKPQPPSRLPVNAPKRQTLHELPAHLVQSSSSASPDLVTSSDVSPLKLPDQPALASPNVSPATEVSPTAVKPPAPIAVRSAGLRRENRSLSRAVTGLENLMEDALHVAKDAADNGRPDDVAHILDSAAAVLRRASTAIPKRDTAGYGMMSSPFEVSPHESGGSGSYSDSEHGVHSGFSSAMHSRDISAETAPTLLTRSAHSSAQPIFMDRYTGKNGKAPMSMRATVKHGDASSADDDDDSIAPTPPRLYQPASAESIVRDFAYARLQNARAQSAKSLSAPFAGYGAAADFYSNNGEFSPPLLRRSIALSQMPMPMAKALPTDKPLPAVPAPVVSPEKDGMGRVKRSSGRRLTQGELRELEHVPTDSEPPRRVDSNNNPAGTVPQRRKKDRYHPHLFDLFETSYYRLPEADHTAKARQLSGVTDTSEVSCPSQAPALLPSREQLSLKHPRRKHISLRDNQPFSLGRYHRRKPIAREWDPLRKRITAAIACANTVFIGLIAGIYAGEVPKIQYQIQDMGHRVILGNVLLFIGLGLTTVVFWPLPLLHGRKPYTLLAFALMLPLQFPQALAVSGYRNPNNPIYRCGLLIPRVLTGMAMGFANINQLPTLFDLFGCSLMSEAPHQEMVSADDARRQGGGVGIWLGIWSFCFVGSLSIGFCIGACIISGLDPSWGFYIVVILLAFFLLINVIAPETRRAPYRRSIAHFFDDSEPEKLKRRVARGEVKLHIENEGPKWWFQEVWAGTILTKRMAFQPGFFVLMVYIAWIYAQVTLVILLLGALLSREYTWQPQYVGLAALSLAIGAFFALPLAKASIFSRSRFTPQRTDSMTMRAPRLTWSSHLMRRCMFTLLLPFAGLAYTLSAPGPSVSWVSPTIFCGLVGFLSNLAIAECVGLIMEVFDTCDLQPGVNQKHRLQSMAETTRRRRTNYSSFPRVCAGFFAAQSLGFFFAAASTGVSGAITRALGAQEAVAVVAAILLVITVLFMCAMFRYKQVQVIPSGVFDRATKKGSIAWGAAAEDPEWKPVIIGNPSGKMRRVNLLEMGQLTRWTEIRRLNRLVRK
ncbi:hypothetical protein B0A55_04184 [Friedmanniomyces simplex]|uniref:Uncharacterized protein n=1 Tax=Friedmanniomyces simplex TaxID=329884 RepID=A0A4U0XN34_9PEZI|nr:hypothetical protein B0A55_04184 [Friedmanniomyces simplex]